MRLVYWGSLQTTTDIVKGQHKSIEYIVPGIIAGSLQSIVDGPIESMKVKIMTGAKSVKLNQMYDGFSPLLKRNVIFAIPVGISTKYYGTKYPILAGALGGFIGSIISQPYDVIKTEMQRHKKEINTKTELEIFREIYKSNPKQLLSGVTMRTTMGCINMGIGFFMLDHIYELLNTSLYR